MRADFRLNLPPIGSHPLRSYALFKPHYLTVPPVTEELLKALPVLVFAAFFSDDRKDILPTALSVGIGFSIDPQGYNYARYSAFVPNARSLLTPDMGIDRSYLSPAEPWRDESRDEMLRMTLRVNGKPDYTLVLPADEDYMDAVKAYLDIDVFADAMLCDIRFKVPYIGELICDTDCPAVEDYNDFAEALEDIWQKDGVLLTYAAVLEAEKPETLRGACELLRNLDNYQRITEGAYGYGQQRLQETLGLDDEAIYELDGYMDFEKYGQDCMEKDCVTKTEFGLLRRLEPPFPEQRQGQRMM